MENWTAHRGRVAGLKRNRSDDDPLVVEAVRDLRASRLEEYISRVVASAPPLTPEQRSHLAVLLLTGEAA